MGAVITKSDKLYEALHNYQIFAGTIPSPFDCYLCIRGIKTLPLRVERINYNGLEVAKFLSKHKNVELVKYPGLETDPYHEIAKKYYKGCGGIVTFILKKVKSFWKKLNCSIVLFLWEVLKAWPNTLLL